MLMNLTIYYIMCVAKSCSLLYLNQKGITRDPWREVTLVWCLIFIFIFIFVFRGRRGCFLASEYPGISGNGTADGEGTMQIFISLVWLIFLDIIKTVEGRLRENFVLIKCLMKMSFVLCCWDSLSQLLKIEIMFL